MFRNNRIICYLFFVLSILSIKTFGQIPQLINYQGYVESEGTPLNGNFTIEFSLLNQLVGGTYLWTEIQNLGINEGKFNVLLGNINEFPANLFSDNELFLEIKIDSEILSPRLQFTSVAYSLLAKNVEKGSIKTDNIIDGSITQSKLSSDITIAPSGPAGGDLSDNYPNPKVQKLQGLPISNVTPTTGQVLKWDGSEWKPSGDTTKNFTQTEIFVSGRLSGDGTAAKPLDISQQDADVGQVLKWDGTTWKPSEDATSTSTSGGDISAVYAGDGLLGGGEANDVTLNVGAGSGITVSENEVSLNQDFTDGLYINEGQENSISSNMLSNLSVTSLKLADNSVNSSKIQSGSITLDDLASNSVNSDKITDNSITSADIAPNIISSINNINNDGGNINLVGGDNISITPNATSKSITISATTSAVGDNLGNHTASQNIKLNGNYLSGDGGNEGIFVNEEGHVGIDATKTALFSLFEIGNKLRNNTSININSNVQGGIYFNRDINNTYKGSIDYLYSNNVLRFTTYTNNAPTEKLRIAQNGNIGVGTSDPTHKLTIGTITQTENQIKISSSNYGGLLFSNANNTWTGGINFYHAKSALLFDTEGPGSAKMIITKDGKVGIRTGNETNIDHLKFSLELGLPTDGSNFFRISSNDYSGILFNDGSTTGTYCGEITYDHTQDLLFFRTKSSNGTLTDRIGITNSGNVGIGTFNPGAYKLYVSGSAYATGGFSNPSDGSLKTNIKTLQNSLQKVLQLRGVNFEWNNKEKYSEGVQMGFIAQEAMDIIPEVVEKKGEYYSMQYAPITSLLVEAVKEQQTIINELKDKVEILEKLIAEINSLSKK